MRDVIVKSIEQTFLMVFRLVWASPSEGYSCATVELGGLRGIADWQGPPLCETRTAGS